MRTAPSPKEVTFNSGGNTMGGDPFARNGFGFGIMDDDDDFS